MPSFRKKPVVIEAVRTHEPMVIETLEGNMQAESGDWIIKGLKGEYYPCKDDIFRQSYEPVDKEGIQALTAPGPNESEECVIPFPGMTPGISLENTVINV